MAQKNLAESPSQNVEQNVYADVYRILLVGMVLSSACFAVGLARALVHPQYVPLTSDWVKQQYRASTIFSNLLHANAETLMMVATVLLILTPVARVVVSIYAFWVDRDHKYVVVTSIVLLVMILAVVLAHFGLQ